MPWRETTDPYLIWVSEVILQQTRVDQGLSYYFRFTEQFPDIRSLAEAAEDDVLKCWQGLGYYSRARNMHAAAKMVMERFSGCFPHTYEEIASLKGIGEYTAAAIASFAFRLPYAAVDGNVYRVLSRIFGIDMPIDEGKGKRYFSGLAQELLKGHSPDEFNQAMMEFGALQCVPRSPDCQYCPLKEKCMAYASGTIDKLPVKKGKTTVKPRYFNYLHVYTANETLLSKRTGKDIWQNLYEFPLIEADHLLSLEELLADDLFRKLTGGGEVNALKQSLPPTKHLLSHRIIHAQFYEIEVKQFSSLDPSYIIVPQQMLDTYAVSRLMQYYLDSCAGM